MEYIIDVCTRIGHCQLTFVLLWFKASFLSHSHVFDFDTVHKCVSDTVIAVLRTLEDTMTMSMNYDLLSIVSKDKMALVLVFSSGSECQIK